MKTRAGHGNSQSGASLVEFALVLPLLLLLLLGVLEFGWGLAQHLDVRHKAREALRVSVVGGSAEDIIDRVCTGDIVENMDISRSMDSDSVGDPVMITVTADIEEITGLFGWAWGPTPQVGSAAEGRVEQEPAPDWSSGADESCPSPP